MRSAPFHNGYGMMTMQGTRKPSWRAFEALKGAGTQQVPVTGGVAPANPDSTVSVFATDGGGGKLGIQAFVANWHRVDAQRYSCDQKTAQCKVDTAGTFTDEALCNANCPSAVAPCSRLVGANAYYNGTGSPIACRPRLINQPCDWASTPSLIGSMVQAAFFDLRS